MTSDSPFDTHQDLFRNAYDSALSFDSFLATGTQHQIAKWRRFLDGITIPSSSEKVITSFKRQLNILVSAGIWCGDCAHQCPMIYKIAQLNELIAVRFIDSESIPILRDELRIHGAARVPVIVALSEDFFEIGRYGDRTLSSYRRKAARELGAACDSGIGLPPQEELQEEIVEWVGIIERFQLLLRVSPMLRRRHND
jgi:thiol-disulfide isomerase/thioredoxin